LIGGLPGARNAEHGGAPGETERGQHCNPTRTNKPE